MPEKKNALRNGYVYLFWKYNGKLEINLKRPTFFVGLTAKIYFTCKMVDVNWILTLHFTRKMGNGCKTSQNMWKKEEVKYHFLLSNRNKNCFYGA